MKLVDLQNPIALAKIIANSNANSIPVNATGTSDASQTEGFPPITMIPEEQGGEAPHGLDFNGFLKMLSSHVFNIQNGTPETFNAAVSSAIGGYPKNALLWLIDDNNSRLLKSTKDDNTDNFLTTPSVIGTSWVNAFPTQDYVDDTFVTKATAQTITGAKTFTQNVVRANTNITKGTNPSSRTYCSVEFTDKNGTGSKNRIGVFESALYTNGDIETHIGAYKYDNNSTIAEKISVIYPKTGNPYTFAPTPTLNSSASGYSGQIATVGWIDGSNSNLVHRTGDEEISGTKTFKASPAVNISQPKFRLQSSTITKGTAPASDTELGWYNFEDNAGRSMGRLRYYYNQNKSSVIQMTAFQANSSGDSNSASIRVVYPASGGAYATAPASDVNGSILTTVDKLKAAKGYYELGNGLIIQWGKAQTSNSSGVFTLPKAFTSTNYVVIITSVNANVPASTNSNSIVTGWGVVKSQNTSNFTAFLCNYENSHWWREAEKTVNWIAIGY